VKPLFNEAEFDQQVAAVVAKLQAADNVLHCSGHIEADSETGSEAGSETGGRISLTRVENDADYLESFSKLRNLKVVLVPGAFHREYPQHRGDGEFICSAIRELGLDITRIDLPSFCSVDRAAEFIWDWFRNYSGEPVMLVSLSKGGADTLAFFSLLESKGIAVEKYCRSWVSICGLLRGTAVVEALRCERARYLLIRLLFKWFRYSISDLDSLSRAGFNERGERALAKLSIPSYHVVGVPRFSELSSRFARRAARRVWALGDSQGRASDGGGILLSDYLTYPGKVIAVYGQDHYFKELCVKQVLAIVLQQESARGFSLASGI